jgi:hypothetical protein
MCDAAQGIGPAATQGQEAQSTMAKTIFTAIDPNGVEHKRTSDRRTYTHTVVFQKSYAKALERASQLYKVDGENFDYYVELAAGQHQRVTPDSGYHASYSAEFIANARANQIAENERRQASAKETIEGHTRESYQRLKRDERVAEVERGKANGHLDHDWFNAGWCGRLDLAQKLAAGYDNARILEARIKQ